MPSNPEAPSRNVLFRLIKQFEDATFDYALRGTRDPEEYALITQDYRRTRKRLYDYVREHTVNDSTRTPTSPKKEAPPQTDNIEDQLRRSLQAVEREGPV